MKKLLLLSMFSLSVTSFHGQDTTSPLPMTKEDYLQRSKGQKIAGFVLLGVGTIFVAIAAPGTTSFETTQVLAVGAVVAVLSSIPLFISSGKNKRRGMNMT